MPRLTHDDRVRVITLLEEDNLTITEIAQRFNVDRRTIQRLRTKHQHTGSVDDVPHNRRARVSTPREDRYLIRLSANNPRMVSRTLRQRWNTDRAVQSSSRTVRRRLYNAGLYGRIAKKKPLLSQRHRNLRLQWANERAELTVEDWRRCLFTDETPVHLIQSRQMRYVRRRGGQAYQPGYTRPTVHSSGGRIMVWGGISSDPERRPLVRVPPTVNAEVYSNLLREHVGPLQLPRHNMVFQQDNATAHRSRRATTTLEELGIEVLPWPAQSPDLNPIENMWSRMKNEIENIEVHGFDALWIETLRVWRAIPQDYVLNLIDSMPRRIQEVIAARGGPIKY